MSEAYPIGHIDLTPEQLVVSVEALEATGRPKAAKWLGDATVKGRAKVSMVPELMESLNLQVQNGISKEAKEVALDMLEAHKIRLIEAGEDEPMGQIGLYSQEIRPEH